MHNIFKFYVATWSADINGCISSDADVYDMVLHDKLHDNQKFDLDIQVNLHEFILNVQKSFHFVFMMFKTKLLELIFLFIGIVDTG